MENKENGKENEEKKLKPEKIEELKKEIREIKKRESEKREKGLRSDRHFWGMKIEEIPEKMFFFFKKFKQGNLTQEDITKIKKERNYKLPDNLGAFLINEFIKIEAFKKFLEEGRVKKNSEEYEKMIKEFFGDYYKKYMDLK